MPLKLWEEEKWTLKTLAHLVQTPNFLPELKKGKSLTCKRTENPPPYCTLEKGRHNEHHKENSFEKSKQVKEGETRVRPEPVESGYPSGLTVSWIMKTEQGSVGFSIASFFFFFQTEKLPHSLYHTQLCCAQPQGQGRGRTQQRRQLQPALRGEKALQPQL